MCPAPECSVFAQGVAVAISARSGRGLISEDPLSYSEFGKTSPRTGLRYTLRPARRPREAPQASHVTIEAIDLPLPMVLTAKLYRLKDCVEKLDAMALRLESGVGHP